MFLRNCWYVAAWADELKDKPLGCNIINEPIMLYRRSGGAVVAMEDRCCHRFAPLSKGRVEGDDIRCMYHGLKFDKTGKCIEIPGQQMIPARAYVRTFAVVEADSWLWVWMGDPAKADLNLVPRAVGFDDPNWTLRKGRMDYEANYQLINDNLTDFTHLSFVHANSFGTSEEFANTRPDVIPLERGVRIQRWITQALRGNSPLDADTRPRRNSGEETWQSYDFLVPGILLMRSRTFPAGTSLEFKGKEDALDEIEALSDNFTSQAVTPMTDSTSRYFFSWGPRQAEGSEAMADGMLAVAQVAFGEDKDMIEAQQRVIKSKPGKEVLTSADVGPMQFRAVIERLARAEAAS